MLHPVSFFFNEPPTTEIYTLSLHDALPICGGAQGRDVIRHLPKRLSRLPGYCRMRRRVSCGRNHGRSEEHTSELQSRVDLVCRLLLEKKKKHQPIAGAH